MVLAPGREARSIAADILSGHGAEFVGSYGRWAWEGLAPSGGPAASAATEGHPAAGRPEDIPRLFMEAWNTRDPDALASWFDGARRVRERDRLMVARSRLHPDGARLRSRAHLQRVTLGLHELRVKHLSDDIAAVHAAMTVSGQSATAGAELPGTRTTILSFVVHKVAGSWMCASAHNTDVVPDNETNVIGDDGVLRAAIYCSLYRQ